jgi:hypothetical protein
MTPLEVVDSADALDASGVFRQARRAPAGTQ